MMVTDTEMLDFLAKCEFATAAGDYICQVITDKGTFQAYHKFPKVGTPMVFSSRGEALRVAILKAMEAEHG